jgi:hypothetical protein
MTVNVRLEQVGEGGEYRINITDDAGNECETWLVSLIYDEEGVTVTLEARCGESVEQVRIRIGHH